MDKELLKEYDSLDTTKMNACPKCGSEKLLRQVLPGGKVELICPNLDCDYSSIDTMLRADTSAETITFAERLSRMNKDQLVRMAENLTQSVETLSGRAKRLAQRQLAMTKAELIRREQNPDPDNRPLQSPQLASPKVPPQFNTPQATAKRVKAIRDYHRRRKSQLAKTPATQMTTSSIWLDRFMKTLKDEAGRHEQAAQHYARVPELFPLHIEHSARAFELNRILDMFTSYYDIICADR